MFLRATNFHLRTSFSAGVLPPLRQTARYLLPIFVGSFVSFVTLTNSNSSDYITQTCQTFLRSRKLYLSPFHGFAPLTPLDFHNAKLREILQFLTYSLKKILTAVSDCTAFSNRFLFQRFLGCTTFSRRFPIHFKLLFRTLAALGRVDCPVSSQSP
jgi:hypothetical protein